MSQISRPMQIALVGTLVLFAVWFVVLRPKPPEGGETASAPAPTAQEAPTAPGVEGLTNAVDNAQDAAAAANRDAQRAQDSDAEATGGASAAAADGDATGEDRSGGADGSASNGDVPEDAAPPGPVRAALRAHKAIAIAFIDPATADARAVRRELLAVSTFGGRAVTVPVPIDQLARYELITRGISVTVAPTVVIVAPNRVATKIVGAADRGEIEQRLADALTARR